MPDLRGTILAEDLVRIFIWNEYLIRDALVNSNTEEIQELSFRLEFYSRVLRFEYLRRKLNLDDTIRVIPTDTIRLLHFSNCPSKERCRCLIDVFDPIAYFKKIHDQTCPVNTHFLNVVPVDPLPKIHDEIIEKCKCERYCGCGKVYFKQDYPNEILPTHPMRCSILNVEYIKTAFTYRPWKPTRKNLMDMIYKAAPLRDLLFREPINLYRLQKRFAFCATLFRFERMKRNRVENYVLFPANGRWHVNPLCVQRCVCRDNLERATRPPTLEEFMIYRRTKYARNARKMQTSIQEY